MSKNNYILTRDGQIVCVPEDTLCHWKYIRKEFVNGNWRYYYDKTPETDKALTNDDWTEFDYETRGDPYKPAKKKISLPKIKLPQPSKIEIDMFKTYQKTAQRYVKKYMNIKIKDLFNGKYWKDHANGEYSWKTAREEVLAGWR